MAKYGDMVASELRGLKKYESENSTLKRWLAGAKLDKASLKQLLGRK